MMRTTTLQQRYVAPEHQSHRMRWLLVLLLLITGPAIGADCDMQLSNGEVGYGMLHRGELEGDARADILPLGKRELTLTIACREPTSFRLQFDSEPAGASEFRFGQHGHFIVGLSQATLDGKPVQLAQRVDITEGRAPVSPSARLVPNGSVDVVDQLAPVTGKVFSAQVEVETYIDAASTRVRDHQSLEGRGSFRLRAAQ
ncbi:hypothetical protein [Burkholderia cenocepacia]|uniref:hypothetical protein n=1 Tax=Burkholderia cenocepacia TaxID=95486 RepID=UPI002860E587|nr:hypothetical protein [Burkholderia cenocepacia]MDR8047988.1 hypothetical protein [Burkholderia cenocepacia]